MPCHALCVPFVAALAVVTAQDPPPPPGGFPHLVREYSAVSALGPITWVDGVRTSLDAYVPLATPPATGWPLVLLVHGGDGNRRIQPLRVRGERLAKAGYVCLAYDVRGEGTTIALNPPAFDASEAARLRDMAEVFARAAEFVPPGVTVDTARLAVSGESMGGRHSFRAAGWSGQALPAPFGPYTHMPAIAAVAPRIAPLDYVGDGIVDDVLCNAETATGIFERGPSDQYYPLLLAEDWAAIAQLLAADPLRNYTPRVHASTVPILITHCWDDQKHQLASTVDALAGFGAGATVSTYWTTNGHGTQSNTIEQAANDEAIRRWFDRFLKGRANGLPGTLRHESGIAPPGTATHLDAGSAWPHAIETAWPPSGTTTVSWYLRSSGGRSLTTSPPNAVEPGLVVDHVALQPGYGVLAFCADNRRPANLRAAWALDDEVATSAPLTAELELAGRPRFLATVDSTAGDFQLTAALYAVAPSGNAKWITAGSGAVKGGAPGTHALTIELDDTQFVLPAGHRLRLVLRNLPQWDCAGHTFVRFVPCFVPGSTTVRIAPAMPAVLDLPVRMRPHAFVTPAWAEVAVAGGPGAVHSLQVFGGSARANQSYLVLLSGAGVGSGAGFAPERLPITLDPWTYAVAAAPTGPYFPGFAGVLDASGRATARVDLRSLALPPGVLGTTWTAAVLGLDSGGYWGGGGAAFVFVP